MAINKQFDRTVSTKRLATVAGSMKEMWQTNLAEVSCMIQPTSNEINQSGDDGAYYKPFKMWCALDTDILYGDKVISGDTVFQVRSVSFKNYGGENIQHLVVMLSLGK